MTETDCTSPRRAVKKNYILSGHGGETVQNPCPFFFNSFIKLIFVYIFAHIFVMGL